MLYRVLAIVGGALALAACTSSSDFGNFGNMDMFKTGPIMDTVRFESEPPGAEAKTSNGQTCRTPCALALSTEQPLTVTYTLTGYESQIQQLEVISVPGETPHLRPNPVVAELTAAPPPAKPKKKRPARTHKPAAKKKPAAASKPAPKPAAAAPARAPAPAAAAPAPAQVPTFAPPPPAAASPWPSPPPQQH